MLRKLRLKFVLINMAIVTIMIGILFGLLYYSTGRNLERESLQMMESIAINPMHLGPVGESMENVRLPYVAVMINHAGEMTEMGGGFFDLSDESLVDHMIQMTQESHKSSGILEGYNVRFLKTETPVGECIVFADMTSEQSTLRNLARTCLLVGLLAFLGFLGISILLARWAINPVEEAWQQQKQFVADASHELKTPLTVIMTDAELLQNESCSEPEREKLRSSILTMSRQMRGLVESLLELARIDNGSVKGVVRSFSLSETMSMAALMFEPVFYEKEMTFSYEVEPGIELKGNESQLKQVADIFLDNAAKYAYPGGITTLRLSRTSRRHCLLEVANQGPPIENEELDKLFRRFYRADQARSMNHSYGLGLAIAQSITEEHKGKIWAESRNGYNRFCVELPTI